MQQFRTDFIAWIVSLVNHLGAIATGGIFVLGIQLLKDRWPKIFNNWLFSKRAAFAFFAFSVFQSWEVEYLSRLGREADLVQAHLENDDLSKSERNLEISCATKEGVKQALEKQNRDQQGTINGCLTQAMKLLIPPELSIAAFRLSGDNSSTTYLLLTNRPLSPFTVVATCRDPVGGLAVRPLPRDGDVILSSQMNGGQKQISRTSYSTTVNAPAWTPMSPITARVVGGNGGCSFSTQ